MPAAAPPSPSTSAPTPQRRAGPRWLLALCLAGLGGSGAVWAEELEVSGSGWRAGRLEGLRVGPRGLSLAEGAPIGTWTHAFSAPPPGSDFDRCLPSLNPEPFPEGASISLRLRFQVAGPQGPQWTDWRPLGRYGRGAELPRSEESPPSRGVQVEVDLVTSARPLLGGEAQLIFRRGAGGAPTLRRLVLDRWRRVEEAPLPPRVAHPAWGQVTAPPERSQVWLGPALAPRTCSPTSLSMVLALHSPPCSSLEVAEGVYDHAGDIYGNWCFNVAYAGTRGLRARARHLSSWREVEDEIAAGRPVVISHRYRAGQLSGATVEATVGHLIVLVGFTPEGELVVHDPAGDTRRGRPIRRVYRRDELWQTWQRNHEGVAYLVEPEGR